MISSLYAAVARARRRHYARPGRQHRLARPVVSIGNLAVGGRGKTPLVLHVAALLRDAGERPSILTRGYRRQDASEPAVVVRDVEGIRADIVRAGDEPLMLARRLDGVVIISGADRTASGRLAEQQYGCTIHVLDDGFQHLALHRDVDIVLVGREDIADPRTLPGGRLREPLDALVAASALVALDGAPVETLAPAAPVWHARRKLEGARLAEPFGTPVAPTGGAVVTVAGIANPTRFFDDLRSAGWPVARSLPYRDHHAYTAADVKEIIRIARDAGASMVVTTEKDLVRLLPFRPFPMPIAFVPMVLSVEPAVEFDRWLLGAVRQSREAA